MTLLAHTRLGPYEILTQIGEGGMGEVYLARDGRLGRKVAIKTLPAEVAGLEKRLNRFRREARIVAALNHPNIVTLYSVETFESLHFLTMEYVKGQTLDKLIPVQGMEIIQFFDLAVQLCEALVAAHGQGVTHRDLKPHNIMVTDDGRLKVLDFGLAKQWSPVGSFEVTALSPGPVAPLSHRSTRIETEFGAVLGTVPYMSPEQAQGLRVDHRSDLFSLGIVLYEMMAGQRPFQGETTGALVASILRDTPQPITSTRTEFSAGLDRIVKCCLEKTPEGRYSTVDSLLRDLVQSRLEVVERRYPERAQVGRAHDESDRSVAIADFVNIAREPQIDWLCTGIAETITVDLKKVPALKLVSRDKVVQAAKEHAESGNERDHVALGRRLGVDWIVSGGFQHQGNAIRVTTQCLGIDGEEIAEPLKIDGTLDQIFELQDRLVRELIHVLNVPIKDVNFNSMAKAGTEEIRAYELYARGRRQIHDMTPSSLGKAEEFLQQAVKIDPGYALAHAGLGQMMAMKFISTTDPTDLEVAIEHLEKSVKIDPALVEPYMWLTYCFARAGRFSEGVVTGRRAVRREPESAFSHYFLGCAFLMQSGRGSEALSEETADHFAEAIRVAPQLQQAHQLLGFVHLFRGDYGAAQPVLERAAEIESSGDYDLARFVGANALLGRLRVRQAELDGALESYGCSLELLTNEDHVYAAAVNGLAYCGRGDVYLRRRCEDDALIEYRLAHQQVMASPRSLGLGWILIRIRLGMACCFHRLGMALEERNSLEEATDLFRTRTGYDFNWVWEGTPADIYVELARYHAIAGRIDEALACLRDAVGSGWCDLLGLNTDPFLAKVRSHPGYKDVAQMISMRTTG